MRAVILLLMFSLAPASAQLYLCKDGDQTRYISAPTADGNCRLQPSYEKNAKPQLQPIQPAPVKPSTAGKPKLIGVPKTTTRPFVSDLTQKQRDDKRGEILLYERAQELQRKDIWLKQLSTTAADDTRRLTLLQEQIRIHELNIVAIEQELARLDIYVDNTGN